MRSAIRRARALSFVLAAACSVVFPVPAFAGAAAPDGSGGTFVVWSDSRSNSGSGIFAQHLGADGVPQWREGGVPVCLAPGVQGPPVIVADGAGGAFVAWQDGRGLGLIDHDIYVQHVDAAGEAAWTADGVLACGAADLQDGPQLALDGAGGVIVVWRDDRDDDSDLYAQRFDASGVPQWSADGVPVATAASVQHGHVVLGDGAGGAFVTWQDHRSGAWQVYAQRLSAALGSEQWTAGGVLLGDGPGDEAFPAACADGAGGWIVAWEDARTGADDIYAQRVSAGGARLWAADGVRVCTEAAYQLTPQVVPGSPAGAIVAWLDGRTGGSDYDLYAQRLDLNGARAWDTTGVAVCTAPAGQGPVAAAADGAGGALFAWEDRRDDAERDVYAQRLDSTGVASWAAQGFAVSADTSGQYEPSIVGDGAGGAWVAWSDGRSRMDTDRYVQHVTAGGGAAGAAGGDALDGRGWQRAPVPVPVGGGNVVLVWMEKVNGQYDVWARKVNSANVTLWGPVAVCSAPGLQCAPVGCSDGASGAILAWLDNRAGGAATQVWAQRVDAAGNAVWAADGVAVCTAGGHASDLLLQSDTAGGGVLAWLDTRSGTQADVYAQRLSPLGVARWATDGVGVCTVAADKSGLALAQDGTRGLFAAWTDARVSAGGHVFAQWVDSTGSARWTADGVRVSASAAAQSEAAATQGVNGGLYVVWRDARDDAGDLYQQRLGRNGQLRLGANGLVLASGAGTQSAPVVASIGNVGAFAAWADTRGGEADVYAQRVDSTGADVWTANGVAVCTATGEQRGVRAIRDNGNGLVVAWEDRRDADWNVYAQRIGYAGGVQWAADGVPVADTAWAQEALRVSSDGVGGIYLAWEDLRDGVHRHVYAQRVDSLGVGQWGSDGVVPALASLAVSEAASDHVRLEWAVTGGAATRGTLERRAEAGEWRVRAELAADGDGRLRFTDRDVTPGTRYAYRLVLDTGGAPHATPEVWVEVPLGRVALALHGVRPQPAVAGEAVVAFALAGTGGARLELLDVMGRRVAEWPLAGLGAGEHVRPLAGLGRVPAGVYMLRVTEGPASVRRRVVLVR